MLEEGGDADNKTKTGEPLSTLESVGDDKHRTGGALETFLILEYFGGDDHTTGGGLTNTRIFCNGGNQRHETKF